METADHNDLFSVVIPTLNEGEMLHMTVNSILRQTAYKNFEIIVLDDGSTDGSCDRYEQNSDPRVRLVRSQGRGVARARNLGAAHAKGKYIVFIDAHCRVSANWLEEFVAALARPEVAIVGPCFTRLESPTPRGCGVMWRDLALDQVWIEPCDEMRSYVVPLTPGGCQAFRRDTFLALGRYDEGFTRWGSEDVELCLRAWLLGYEIEVCPHAVVAHHFRESRGFAVDDLDILYNFLRMIHMHFSPPRIRGVLKAIAHNPHIQRALDRLYESDIFSLRQSLLAKRVRSDDWFFERFDRRQCNRQNGGFSGNSEANALQCEACR